ncbi:MAG TPA: hypothetical protein VI056_12930 [Candidatus Limnocylindria bacterium]
MSRERELEDLFAQLERIELPPAGQWEPAVRSPRSWWGALLRNAGGVALLAVLTVGILAFGLYLRQPTRDGGAAASGSPTATPSPSVSSGATSTPASSLPTGVETRVLGRPVGEFAYAVLEVPLPGNTQLRSELWQVPLEGTPAQLALAWVRSAGGLRIPAATVVGRQLSPDGRSFVLTGTAGLVLVDLPTGQARAINDNADGPIWSPDGSRIAFTRWLSESTPTSWMVRPDGSDLQQITADSGPLLWSPDSQLLATASGVYTARPGGSRVSTWPDPLNNGANPISWRQSAPQLGSAASSSPNGGEQRLEVFDVGSAPRVVARETGSREQTTFTEPRWHPTASQLLYTRLGSAGNEVRIADLASGAQQRLTLAGTPRRAEWNPAGTRVLYITTVAGHDELRFTSRFDGSATNEGLLLSTESRVNARITDLAAISLR